MPEHLTELLIVASGLGSVSPNSVVNIITRIRGAGKTPITACYISENINNLYFGGGANIFSALDAVSIALARTDTPNQYILKAFNNHLTLSRTLEYKIFEI